MSWEREERGGHILDRLGRKGKAIFLFGLPSSLSFSLSCSLSLCSTLFLNQLFECSCSSQSCQVSQHTRQVSLQMLLSLLVQHHPVSHTYGRVSGGWRKVDRGLLHGFEQYLLQSRKDLQVFTWFLLSKLIAGKAQYNEAKGLQLLLKCVQFCGRDGARWQPGQRLCLV